MRNTPLLLLALAAVTGGCNTFTTVEDACLDQSPGEANITEASDAAIFNRMNCYRRVSKRVKAPVDKLVQLAVENHRDWAELNAPSPETLRSEAAGTELFTGNNVIQRLTGPDVGYIFQPNTEVLEVVTIEVGDYGDFFVGEQHFDFWFDDPFLRPSFLQNVVTGAGVAEGSYIKTFPVEFGIPDQPVSFMYWNIVYSSPAQPYAEVPVMYPRSGQTDAPPRYVHLSGNQSLELGRTYGYPVTFTVGTRETGLEVTQASFRRIDDNGEDEQLPFIVLTGNDAITALRLRNTAILVPELPLEPGSTYQADVKIKSDQGERRARTLFTVGGESRDIPPGVLRQAVELDMPVYDYQVFSLDEPRVR